MFQDLNDSSRESLSTSLGLSSEEELYQLLDAASASKTTEEQLLLYMEYKIHKFLLLYIPPLLLIIGTIGNVLSFCVLIRKAMRRTSTYNYLAVLSFTDMLVLYIGLLRLWVGELTEDVRDMSDWSCKFITMAGYTVSVYSVWLLIAVTVERYIVTVHSLRASTMCTQGRAVKTIVCILILLLSINLHFLWTTQIQTTTRNGEIIQRCNGASGYEHLIKQVWPWVDACLYCILPFIIICILNCLIVQKVIISRKSRHLLAGSRLSSSSSNSPRSSNESSARVTIMLLTISFTFLICTLPMNVTMIHQAYRGFNALSLQEEASYRLARTISELLMYTNHSINFYLYLLTGNKFRQQLLTMLCPCNRTLTNVNYSVVTQDVNRTTKVNMDTEMTVIRNGNYSQISDDTD